MSRNPHDYRATIDEQNARSRELMSPSKRDRAEFAEFCRNATTAQLRNILDKEESAGRDVYAEIARKELEGRANG